ncbi:hypothetical protein NDU88_000885 [Pleurodeles waltl]|uniref:Uncharacterized protein n=1 Tax=Pleurodeles waltl TaxID=8319 RepID=A0AAV7L840_PLEWA|nr:hypothetical protein NDU88_000885 [Pleurodeles waltl]
MRYRPVFRRVRWEDRLRFPTPSQPGSSERVKCDASEIGALLMQFCLPGGRARIRGVAHLFVSQECPPRRVQMTSCSSVLPASSVTDRRDLLPELWDSHVSWGWLVTGRGRGSSEHRE